MLQLVRLKLLLLHLLLLLLLLSLRPCRSRRSRVIVLLRSAIIHSITGEGTFLLLTSIAGDPSQVRLDIVA